MVEKKMKRRYVSQWLGLTHLKLNINKLIKCRSTCEQTPTETVGVTKEKLYSVDMGHWDVEEDKSLRNEEGWMPSQNAEKQPTCVGFSKLLLFSLEKWGEEITK